MITLKKGKYYIGDPCYVFNKSWIKVLKETDFFENTILFGYDIIGGGTSHGDGTYYDNFLNEYYVDAGLIACLPVELLKIDNVINENDEPEGYIIYEFEKDFKCEIYNGDFFFGKFFISTNYEE